MTRRGSPGAVALEFAIVGSALVTMFLLALEVGWQVAIDAALNAGARAASRFGSTGTTVAAGITPAPTDRNASIEQLTIVTSGGLLLPSRLQINEMSYASFAALSSGAGTAGPGDASQVVRYSFTYTQPYLTPIAAAITGQSQIVHSVTITVLNEPFPED